MPQISPNDLVLQANQLAGRGKSAPPSSADLRRAVSNAYYALYHCITRQVTLYILPQASSTTRYEFVRHFKHEGIRQVCTWLTQPPGQIPKHATDCAAVMRACPDLVVIANTFTDLQQARHDADYNHAADFTKEEVLGLIDLAINASSKLIALSTPHPVTKKCDPNFEVFAAHVTMRAQLRQG